MPAAPAIIGAVGAIGGGMMQSRGASAAADAQAQASQQANQAQLYMFNQSRGDMLPQIQAGNVARNNLMEMLGLGGQLSQQPIMQGQNPYGGPNPQAQNRPGEEMPNTVGNPGGLWDALTGSSAENRTRALIHGPLASIAPDPFLDGLYPDQVTLPPLDFTQGMGVQQGFGDPQIHPEQPMDFSNGPGYQVGPTQGGVTNGPAQTGQTAQQGQPGMSNNTGLDAYLNSTGYQFERDQGLQSVDRGAAARGGALSGRAMIGSQRFGQGLASTRAGDYMNRLAALAGAGQTASSNIGSLGMGTGQGIANNLQNAGNARASGYINQGNAYGNMFNSLGQMGAYYYGNQGGGNG